MNHRAFAFGELKINAHRLDDQKDVREDDRGIDTETLGGGDGHFRRQLGRLASSRKLVRARTSRYSRM